MLNKYAGSMVAPPFGTIVSTNTNAWAPGLFTSALSGQEGTNSYNYVDSVWVGPLQGSFRAFTSGAAGVGLIVGGYGGSNLDLTKDIRTPARTRWVHVALVVDDATMQATYYVDGVPEAPLAVSAKVNVPARATGFRVGMHTRLTTGSFWDLDDFRLVNRVASAFEIPLPLPNDPSLAGFKAYNQCLIFPAASPIQSSSGFLFTIRP